MTFRLQIGPQDMGRKREFTYNGAKYVAEAQDPYGFVTVFCIKTKENLDSQFTGFKEAEVAAEKHSLNIKKV